MLNYLQTWNTRNSLIPLHPHTHPYIYMTIQHTIDPYVFQIKIAEIMYNIRVSRCISYKSNFPHFAVWIDNLVFDFAITNSRFWIFLSLDIKTSNIGNVFLQRHENKYCLTINNTLLTNNLSLQFGSPSIISSFMVTYIYI